MKEKGLNHDKKQVGDKKAQYKKLTRSDHVDENGDWRDPNKEQHIDKYTTDTDKHTCCAITYQNIEEYNDVAICQAPLQQDFLNNTFEWNTLDCFIYVAHYLNMHFL